MATWSEVPDREPIGGMVDGIDLMQVLARACGHQHLSEFSLDDLTTFDRDMAHLTGIAYGGVLPA